MIGRNALLLAGIGCLINPPPVTFRRSAAGDWESWHELAHPRPPHPKNAPFEPCRDHANCSQWHGVHFNAIRFGERVWCCGWQESEPPAQGDGQR